MKTKYFCKTGMLAALPIGCVAGLGILTAQAEEGKLDYSGTLGLGVGGADVDGNKAAYQRRVGQDGDFYGGLSDLHVQTESGDVLYTLDGHAMFGNNDYEFILGAVKEGTGYLQVGYREFTTFYDGTGGYLPGAVPAWYSELLGDEFELDRGEVWVEAGLRMEDKPEYTFRYTHKWRDGMKDSTIWGRPDTAGIMATPSNIDEESDIFEFDVAHTIGNTDLGLGLRYELMDNYNSRLMTESTTQTDSYEADLFNAHSYSVSRLNEQMILSFGYSFTTMDTDTDGSSRISDPLAGHDWFDAVGGANFKQHVANANFWWNASENLVIVPSLRIEREDTDALIDIVEIPRGADPTDPNVYELLQEQSNSDYEKITEQIDIRYTGCDNILLYAKVMASQANGNTNYWALEDYHLDGSRTKSYDADTEKYTVGANWYPLRKLSFSAEYFHKDYDSDYDNQLNGFDAHLASHDISTDDFNVRLNWRALPNLTLVTRYDWAVSQYDTKGIDGGNNVLAEIESGESDRNIISQSLTYMPREDLYMTGFVSYTWAETVTASSAAVGGLATSDRDYLTAGATVGYAIDEKTDITAGYSYYYADNYTLPTGGVGYGTDLEEHVISVGLNRLIQPNMVWNLGYAYYTSDDGTSGGRNDFDAHMLSSGLQVKF